MFIKSERIIENNNSKYKNNIKIKNIVVNTFNFIFEEILEKLFLICAFISIICVLAITVFIFIKGVPAIFKIGIFDFIFGSVWNPSKNIFGIFPMIIGSLAVTLISIIIGMPIGIMTAIFISKYSSKNMSKIINPAIELLSGIPSVIYGFFGVVVIVPIISNTFGGAGNSLIAASIILGIMILPTIISTAKTSLNAVPKEYEEGSIALGATKEQTIFNVILIAAKSGIISGIVLGIGRAVGETMAVILVAGNSAVIPKTITEPVRTLTANISLEMGYASGLHQEALFATGVILFIFIMILNIAINVFSNKAGEFK